MNIKEIKEFLHINKYANNIVNKFSNMGYSAKEEHWEVAYNLIFDDDVAERATDIYDFYYEESGTNSDKDNVIEFTRAFNDAANILKVFIDINDEPEQIANDNDDDFYSDDNLSYSVEESDDGKHIDVAFSMHGRNVSDFRLLKGIAESLGEDLIEACKE